MKLVKFRVCSLKSQVEISRNSSAVGYLKNDSLKETNGVWYASTRKESWWQWIGCFDSEMHIDFPDMGEVIVIERLCCLGFTVSCDQVRSTIRSTANIAQVRSLKTGSIVFPLVTFSCNENTLHVTNTDNSNTQTLQSRLSKTQVGNPFLSLQLS